MTQINKKKRIVISTAIILLVGFFAIHSASADNKLNVGSSSLILGSSDNLMYGNISSSSDAASSALLLQNNGSDLFRVLSGGNVGIGDSTPTVKLDVKGLVQFDDTNTFSTYKFSGSTVQTNSIEIMDRVNGGVSDGIYPTLTFHDYGNGGAQFSMEGATRILHLASGAYDSAGTLATGSSYFSKLKIHGELESTSILTVGGGAGNVVNVSGGQVYGLNSTPTDPSHAVPLSYLENNYSPSSGDLWSGTKNGNIWNGDAGVGNVGIGAISPETALHVNRSYGSGVYGDMLTLATQDGNTGAGTGIRFRTAVSAGGVTTARIKSFDVGSYDGVLAFEVGSHSGYSDTTTERMRITHEGNVGIGTTDPKRGLHVYEGGLRVGPYYDPTDRDYVEIMSHGTDTRVRSYNERFHIENTDASGALILNGSGGNVGIGTTDPTGKLHVSDDTENAIRIGSSQVSRIGETDDGSYAGMKISPYNNNIHFGISSNNNTKLNIWHAGSNYLYIQQNAAEGVISNYATSPLALQMNGGNVGVGTINPAGKLDIKTPYELSKWALVINQSNTAALSPASHDQVLIQRQDVASLKMVDIGDSNALGFASGDGNSTISSSNTLRFYVNGNMSGAPHSGMSGTLAMKIEADGSVGIGTTTPSTLLGVSGTAGDAIDVNGGQVSGLDATQTNPDHAVSLAYLENNYSPSSGEFWGGSLGGDISNANSGNVGIGTTEPEAPLQIVKTVANGTETPLLNLYSKGAGVNHGSSIQFKNDGGGYMAAIAGLDDAVANGRIEFRVNPTGIDSTPLTNANTVMTIKSNGNVGIGTTNPSSGKLQIDSGNLYLSGTNNKYIGLNSGSNWQYFLSINNDDFKIYDSNNTEFLKLTYNGGGVNKFASVLGTLHVTNNGNVGIGTTAPTGKLDIRTTADNSKGLYLYNGRSNSWVLDMVTTKGDYQGIRFKHQGGSGGPGANGNIGMELLDERTSSQVTSSDAFFVVNRTGTITSAALARFRSHGVEALFIKDDGSVGIGTTTPSTLLDISGTAGDAIDVSGGQVSGLPSVQTNDDHAVSLKYLTDNYHPSSGDLWSGTKNGNIWNGDAGVGNVGIGTNNPEAKLDVDGGDIKLAYTVGTNPFTLRAINDALWLFGDGATTQQWVLADSYTHDRAIHLSYTPGTIGAATGLFKIGQTSKNNENWTHGITALYTNGAERIRINASGNVGIGTTNPGTKLQVFTGGNSLDAAMRLTHDSFGTDRKVGLTFSFASHAAKGGIGFNADAATTNGLGNVVIAVDSNDDTGEVAESDAVATFTHGGNVGIGTTNPTLGKLQVSGSVSLGNDTSNWLKNGNAWFGRNASYDTAEIRGYGAELMIGAQNASAVHINYRQTNGANAPQNWYWRAGSSSSWSDHHMKTITLNNSTGDAVDVNGGQVADLASTPLNADHAVPLGYLESNYSPLIRTHKTIADTDYTILDSDYIIGYSSITANRTVTLPDALCNPGRFLVILDESGDAGSSTAIIIDPEGSTPIVGGPTFNLVGPYNAVYVFCGNSAWFVL